MLQSSHFRPLCWGQIQSASVIKVLTSHLSSVQYLKSLSPLVLITGLQSHFPCQKLISDGGMPSCPQLWIFKSNSPPCVQILPIGFFFCYYECCFYNLFEYLRPTLLLSHLIQDVEILGLSSQCLELISLQDFTPGTTLTTSSVFLTVGVPQACFPLIIYIPSLFVVISNTIIRITFGPYSLTPAYLWPGSLGSKTKRPSRVKSSKGFIIGIYLHKQL